MANTSIFAAFHRMWQHALNKFATLQEVESLRNENALLKEQVDSVVLPAPSLDILTYSDTDIRIRAYVTVPSMPYKCVDQYIALNIYKNGSYIKSFKAEVPSHGLVELDIKNIIGIGSSHLASSAVFTLNAFCYASGFLRSGLSSTCTYNHNVETNTIVLATDRYRIDSVPSFNTNGSYALSFTFSGDPNVQYAGLFFEDGNFGGYEENGSQHIWSTNSVWGSNYQSSQSRVIISSSDQTVTEDTFNILQQLTKVGLLTSGAYDLSSVAGTAFDELWDESDGATADIVNYYYNSTQYSSIYVAGTGIYCSTSTTDPFDNNLWQTAYDGVWRFGNGIFTFYQSVYVTKKLCDWFTTYGVYSGGDGGGGGDGGTTDPTPNPDAGEDIA